MNKTLFATTVVASLLVTSAFGQGAMKDKGMQGKHKMGMQKMHHPMMAQDNGMSIMMHGLSPAEKQTAMHHMQRMTPSQHAVAVKVMKNCMNMGHTGKAMGHMDDKMMMSHMTMGLKPGEKKTFNGMWMGMSASEKAVAKKMMMNCMMSGKMGHQGHMGHMSGGMKGH
jgi:hypothetical protein